MILSIKPMEPLILPCACGCAGRIIMPRRIVHIARTHWRYKVQQMWNGGIWLGVAILDTHYFQPKHRHARRYWKDTRPRRRQERRPRCTRRLTTAPLICYTTEDIAG